MYAYLPGCILPAHLQAKLQEGTLVVPLIAGAGSWRKSAVFNAEDLYAVADGISSEAAATMSIKYCLAVYCM